MWRIFVTALLLLLAAAVRDVHSYGGPEVTDAPTEAPTGAPTDAPTYAPTPEARRYVLAPVSAAPLRRTAKRRSVK